MNTFLLILCAVLAAGAVAFLALVVVSAVETYREGRRPNPVVVTGDLRFLPAERGVVLAWRTRPATMSPAAHDAALAEVRRIMPTLAEQLDRLAAEHERTVERPASPFKPAGPVRPAAVPLAGTSAPAGSIRARAAAQRQAVALRDCENHGHVWEGLLDERVAWCSRCGAMEGTG